MIPSPTDLCYFLGVADTLNLSRAAERLGISQPSLTLAMTRLENAVGTTILIRHKRGVSLTTAGKQLLAATRKLMEHWDTIRTDTLASRNEAQGTFTIGCHPSLATCILPRFLPQLLEQHPKLEIKLRHDLSRRITEQVIQSQVDVGIVVNPVKHPDLVIKKIADDKVTLYQALQPSKLQQLHSPHTILICDPELIQTQMILKKMKKQGLNYQRLLPTNSLDIIAELTESGTGIGVLPHNVAKHHQIKAIPKTPHYADEIYLLYHGQNRDVKGMQVITQAIKESFKTE